jgi:orotidine-5'-phosphate decarboxylase
MTKTIIKTEIVVERDVQSAPFKNPLIVSLDVDSVSDCEKIIEETSDLVGGYKIGPRLLHRYGQGLVEKISKSAPVFVDAKFFDIASVMVASVKTAFESGASVCTIHSLAGEDAMRKLAELEHELNKIRPFKILAVTILTSWNESSYPPPIKNLPISEHVLSLALLAKKCGLSGVVCSPMELELLDAEDLFLVTPGIRFPDDHRGEQVRVLTPGEAMKSGASAIVVGRPIIEAKNIRDSAMDYVTAVFAHINMGLKN